MSQLSGSTPSGIAYPIGGVDQYDPAGAIQALAHTLEEFLGGTALLDRFYPVGTIYESTTLSTGEEVAAQFGGGTWVPTQQGRFSVGHAATGTSVSPDLLAAAKP